VRKLLKLLICHANTEQKKSKNTPFITRECKQNHHVTPSVVICSDVQYSVIVSHEFSIFSYILLMCHITTRSQPADA